ncbi:MAG: hypothetical protein J7K40_06835 [candidate division Zixibacteria bacterium]|nr:hypothetical protein [candidate division Zixibacteria bacterium]
MPVRRQEELDFRSRFLFDDYPFTSFPRRGGGMTSLLHPPKADKNPDSSDV